jgi:predicted ATP-binding protein involved in virulence
MELLFVWIKKHKGLSELGINFSNEFKFNFDETKNTIEIVKERAYIPNFFGDNICSLTGLIGENGTGKTSILGFILEYLSQGIHNNSENDNVYIFRKGDEINYNSLSEITFIGNISSLKFKRIKDLDDIKSQYTTVYFSNAFDPTSRNSTNYTLTQFGETKNLSTQYLIYKDYQEKTGNDALVKNISYQDRMSAFASLEFVRMARLIRWLNLKEAKGHEFPVSIPKYLNISLIFNDNEYGKTLSQLEFELKNYFNISKNNKNNFLLQSFLAAVNHWMFEIKFTMGPKSINILLEKIPLKIIQYLKSHTYNRNPSNSIVPEFHDIFYFLIRDEEYHVLQSRIEKIQTFFEKLGEYIFKPGITFTYGKDNRLLSVEYSKAYKKASEELIEAYHSTDQISGYLEFYFSHVPENETNLSSGEYAILSIFSRLNAMKLEYNKPLLLLIDEAELALHPQWQKEFIYHFVDFISEKFSNRKVQIILTSHSPFILSDIPTNCLVLLKRQQEKTIALKNLNDSLETFGANIHELFTDTFFLKDGLMGEFARHKIKELILEIDKADNIENDYYEASLKNRISIIGEPFLRAKIFELVASKSKTEVIDKIITQRSSELEILNRIRQKKADDQNNK